ncbi:MAG TPA: response regulator [Phenylobacterium sp.]
MAAPPKPLIFIADDDPLVVSLVQLRLSMAGYDVKSAGDGVEALEALNSLSPSLIILDLEMPRLGGLDTLKHLRNHPRLKATPMLVLTASADSADVVSARRLGAVGYVLKPFKPDLLAQRVNRLTRHNGIVWTDDFGKRRRA